MGHIGNIITGISSFNYLFTIGHAILISVALLLYEGRRWRLFAQCVLVAILFTPTYQGGTPFDLLSRLPIIVDAFFVDIVFNSAYGFFEKRNQLIWWAILSVIIYCTTNPFYFMLNMYLFYPTEILIPFVNVAFFMLPVIFIQSNNPFLITFSIGEDKKSGLIHDLSILQFLDLYIWMKDEKR